MTPLLLFLGSLSLGVMRRLLMVCPPWKCTCTPYLLHVFWTFSLRPWWYGTNMYSFWLLVLLGPFWLFVLLCFVLLGFWLFSFALCMAQMGYLHFLSALNRCCSSYATLLDVSIWCLLCDTGYQPDCIWMVYCGGCPIAGTNKCKCVSWTLMFSHCHVLLELSGYLEMALIHPLSFLHRWILYWSVWSLDVARRCFCFLPWLWCKCHLHIISISLKVYWMSL